MKPFLNIDDITDYEQTDEGDFAEQFATIGKHIGAKKLGYSVTVLQPGKKVCPFHNHHVAEEMFLILEGEGTLRFGDQEYPIKKHDVIACPPGGREVAHQIVNTSNKPLKYFCLGTEEECDICEYPDSDKMLAVAGASDKRRFRHISRMKDAVDYFQGEK